MKLHNNNSFHILSFFVIMIFLLSIIKPVHNQPILYSQTPSRILGPTVDITSIDPRYFFFDHNTNKGYLVEYFSNRVFRFSSSILSSDVDPEIVFGQTSVIGTSSGSSASQMNGPSSGWVDSLGRLWITDYANNRLLRFDSAATISTNGVAASAIYTNVELNGQIISFSTFAGPYGINGGSGNSFWISNEYCLVYYVADATTITGTGTNGLTLKLDGNLGTSGTQHCVDVCYFDDGSCLSNPQHCTYDLSQSILYCNDAGHSRVVGWSYPEYAAGEYGSKAFSFVFQSPLNPAGAQTLFPGAVAAKNNNLMVADATFNHIVIFYNANALGASTTNYTLVTDLHSPAGLWLDPTTSQLWAVQDGTVINVYNPISTCCG